MEVKPGQIVLIRSYNFSARLIHIGMFIRYLLRFRKPQRVYNHAAIGLSGNKISEALAHGIEYRDINCYQNKRCEILIYEFPFSVQQLYIIDKDTKLYEGVKYQFINFIQFIPEIFLGIWLGRKKLKADDQLYCTEYVGLLINRATYQEHFKKHWRVSPIQLKDWCEKYCKKVAEYKV